MNIKIKFFKQSFKMIQNAPTVDLH